MVRTICQYWCSCWISVCIVPLFLSLCTGLFLIGGWFAHLGPHCIVICKLLDKTSCAPNQSQKSFVRIRYCLSRQLFLGASFTKTVCFLILKKLLLIFNNFYNFNYNGLPKFLKWSKNGPKKFRGQKGKIHDT